MISGYLISKHILYELGTNSFSTRVFYARRVKRIFPALALVLLACIVAGWVILTPGEYEALGRPIAGGAAFAANFVFWSEAGYFDTAADTKPLLHLWSLGIEEQFYILWPFILTLAWRRVRSYVGVTILGLLCISLVYSLWLVRHDVTADFYSPLTRFWELALGALLAYAKLNNNLEFRRSTCQFLAWLGLAAIIGASIVLHHTDPFPGAWALLPTLGSAMLIASQHAWLNQNVLASKLFVWFGLISYPLYLWHWPLLSFARIMESETPSTTIRLWLIAISIVLAWITYRFLERPVRASSGQAARKYVWVLCLIMLLLFAAGVTIRKLDGLKFRFHSRMSGDVSTLTLGHDRDKLNNSCGVPAEQKHLFHFCLSKSGESARYAMLGDSKAEALFYGLARESTPGMSGTLIGTVVPPELQVSGKESEQHMLNRIALNTAADNPSVKVVIFVVAMRSTFPINSTTGFIEKNNVALSDSWLARYSDAIGKLQHAGKQVMFVIDNPTFPDPRSCVEGGLTSSPFLNKFLRRKPNPRCNISLDDHIAGTGTYRAFVDELARRNPGLTIYDPTPLLCSVERNACSVTRDGNFLYSYSDHISDYANSLIAKQLLPKIESLAN